MAANKADKAEKKERRADARVSRREDGVYELPRARDVRIVREAIAQMPEVRAEKVERLRAMIADGAYRPDSRAAAANILRESALDKLSARDFDD